MPPLPAPSPPEPPVLAPAALGPVPLDAGVSPPMPEPAAAAPPTGLLPPSLPLAAPGSAWFEQAESATSGATLSQIEILARRCIALRCRFIYGAA
jgi:hypothetical protein